MFQVSSLCAAPLQKDSFTRTVSNGWGTATLGGAWVATGGTASNFSVSGSTGQVKLTSAGSRLTTLPDLAAYRDTEALCTVSLDKIPTGGSYVFTGLALRISSDNLNYYYMRFRNNASGSVYLAIEKIVGGSATNLTPVDGSAAEPMLLASYALNQRYRLRFSVASASPTILRAKVWPEGTHEPPTWNLTVEDSDSNLQAAGKVGIRTAPGSSYVTADQVSYAIDDFASHNVSFVANLQTALNTAAAGDIIYFSGTQNSPFSTVNAGTGTAPIIVRGINTSANPTTVTDRSVINGTDPTTASNHNLNINPGNSNYVFDGFTITNGGTGLWANTADNCVIANIHINHIGRGGMNVYNRCHYWQIANCLVEDTGNNNTGGNYTQAAEGIYIGSTESHWQGQGGAIDDSGYIEVLNCYVRNTRNDSFDIKEGSHHVKYKGCTSDFEMIWPHSVWTNYEFGNDGWATRANNIQLIDCKVINDAHGDTGASAYKVDFMTTSGTYGSVSYGKNYDFKNADVPATIFGAAFELQSASSTGLKIYTDCDVAPDVPFFHSGNGTYTQPDPATFVEMTWTWPY